LQKLKEEAIRELRKDIQKRNTINNSSLKLLSIPKTIIFSQKDISLETGIKV